MVAVTTHYARVLHYAFTGSPLSWRFWMFTVLRVVCLRLHAGSFGFTHTTLYTCCATTHAHAHLRAHTRAARYAYTLHTTPQHALTLRTCAHTAHTLYYTPRTLHTRTTHCTLLPHTTTTYTRTPHHHLHTAFTWFTDRGSVVVTHCVFVLIGGSWPTFWLVVALFAVCCWLDMNTPALLTSDHHDSIYRYTPYGC